MDVLVVVPRRAGDEWRDRLWRLVCSRWFEFPWPLREGHHADGPFNRSAAINQAAQGAWDVLVVADADTLIARDQVAAAIETARVTDRLVVAHTRYRAMTRASTVPFLEHGRWAPRSKWEMTNSVSGCLAIGRSLWDEVGGFDERFEGWGYEDRAFAIACDAFAGEHERIAGDVHHLWHARSPERNPDLPEYQAAAALVRRYKDAGHDADQVRDLLAERQPALLEAA